MEDLLKEERRRREFWVVGPEYTDSEKEFRVLWNELVKLGVPFDRPGSYNDPIGGSLHLSLWNGTFQVHGKSAKHPETLVGEGLTGVVLAEAAKLKHRVWTKFIRPMLADYHGWALMTSTPEGKNWFYEGWQAGQDPNMLEWASWRMPSWLNPFVYRLPTSTSDVHYVQQLMTQVIDNRRHTAAELVGMYGLTVDSEVISLLDDLTDDAFNQEIGADFTEFVGRVFKEFDEEVHVQDLEFNPRWLTVGASDYGFTNPNVWLLIQVGPWGEVHVLDEVYERGLTSDEFAEEIVRRDLAPFGLTTFYPDPEDPGSTKTLEKVLRVRASGGTGGELYDRLQHIREALRPVPRHLDPDHPEKQPTLVINRRCINTIREMQDYRYPDTKEEAGNTHEKPLKKDDHTPEALGRFFAGYFGRPQLRGGTTVHKGSVARKGHKPDPNAPTVNANGTLRYPHSGPPTHGMIHGQRATPEQLRQTKKRNWE